MLLVFMPVYLLVITSNKTSQKVFCNVRILDKTLHLRLLEFVLKIGRRWTL